MNSEEKIFFDVAYHDIKTAYSGYSKVKQATLYVGKGSTDIGIYTPGNSLPVVFYNQAALDLCHLTIDQGARIMVKALNKFRFGISLG